MGNPAVPVERARLLGNPGRRPLPDGGLELVAGWVEPLRPLDSAGQQLWDAIFAQGEIWISGRTDAAQVQLVCEQLDRREVLREAWLADPLDRTLNMNLNELEKLIQVNLGLLGFNPSDRRKLGVAEVKAQNELEKLQAKKARRDAGE